MQNVDSDEIKKFADAAAHWWDPQGEFKPLHVLNPVRLSFIQNKIPLFGKKILDVGCGGGILAESMAQLGADVTGIDLASASLETARLHLLESHLHVNYREISAEELANQEPNTYDIVTCMEMLEHVPDPVSIVHACSKLVKPGGHVFFSTINRHPKAYLFAIVGAEYLLRLLPKGTHHYAKFIRPAELSAWARAADLSLQAVSGMHYNPCTHQAKLSRDTDVNYLAYYQKT
jgi:2-polyprenyl-6-hydroxyphenyl methylase/3-demethylubiquinone-9 3-methyltransferase